MDDGQAGMPMSSDRAVESHVAVEVSHRLGSLQLAASFEASADWTVLFGPSGSGKSTILRTIAGLIRPDRGRVSVLGRPVVDTAAGTWIEPHRRRIRWAGQRSSLFPRKTVRWNLAPAMSLERSFAGRGWIDELDRALDVFEIRHLADKRPAELSGGERQRVSVVRAAIGARGRILLLDEPFAGLDATVRERLIGSLRQWLQGAPIVSVTHDVGESFLLGAEIVRISEGRVIAQGPVATVLAAERASLRSHLD
jgi:molybdate transport system ATP-binding protein